MSLYNVQKFLYELNRHERVQQAYRADPHQAVAGYDLDEEERGALLEPDIGLLYHLGVNGQILMHFAAFCGIEWSDYLQRMRDGVERYGQVRAGVYALAGYEGVKSHSNPHPTGETHATRDRPDRRSHPSRSGGR